MLSTTKRKDKATKKRTVLMSYPNMLQGILRVIRPLLRGSTVTCSDGV